MFTKHKNADKETIAQRNAFQNIFQVGFTPDEIDMKIREIDMSASYQDSAILGIRKSIYQSKSSLNNRMDKLVIFISEIQNNFKEAISYLNLNGNDANDNYLDFAIWISLHVYELNLI